ncbi:MAG: flagellar protein FlgN [Azonexus sp.]|nr:flagellar protein FlgN [Azonexus sp.]
MGDIAAITKREISLISRFVALLKDEQEALKQANASALPEICASKIELVKQLNGLEIERRSALGIVGEEKTRQAMTQWLAKHAENKTAAVNWENLLNLAHEAKELHELNAHLLGLHLQQTSEALAILTRQSAEHSLYGSNGQAGQFTGSRIIDSA